MYRNLSPAFNLVVQMALKGSVGEDVGDGEDVEEEEEDEEDYSNVVQGTTETLLNKLEENLAGCGGEKETLQECEPGDLEEDGKDIDQVLGIISNSIYRYQPFTNI